MEALDLDLDIRLAAKHSKATEAAALKRLTWESFRWGWVGCKVLRFGFKAGNKIYQIGDVLLLVS